MLARTAQDSFTSPDRPIHFEVQGDAGLVPSDIVTPLAVVLNELLQNAVDHAFTREVPFTQGRTGLVEILLIGLRAKSGWQSAITESGARRFRRRFTARSWIIDHSRAGHHGINWKHRSSSKSRHEWFGSAYRSAASAQLGQLVRELRATSRWPSSTNLSASSVAFTTQLATLLFRSPAHTPESWLVFNANSRHMSFTEQSTHTALAAAICRNALPVEPIGKEKEGSASRHLAVFLHTPLSSNIDPRALTSLFPPGATREQGFTNNCPSPTLQTSAARNCSRYKLAPVRE